MREVEAKYRLDDRDRFAAALAAAGFVADRTERHRDRYLRHPCRDFAATDEALRMRSVFVHDMGRIELTYKGPRSAGAVKSREEIELELPQPDTAAAIFDRLGFEAVAEVAKVREVFRNGSQPDLTVTIDTVEQVGTYAEVERLVADDAGEAAAAEAVLAAAESLGLAADRQERRSYLELLLEGAG